MKGVNIQHTYCTCLPGAFVDVNAIITTTFRIGNRKIQFQQISQFKEKMRNIQILHNSFFLKKIDDINKHRRNEQ